MKTQEASAVEYITSPDGLSIYADVYGRHIAEISFIRVGLDKIVIEHTEIAPEYTDTDVGVMLVRRVCDLARAQHRKISPLCPFARAVFCRHPEFDDLRIIYTR